MRLFVSVDLPDGMADPLASLQEPLDRPGVRPTDPDQAHVTLAFLGETDPQRVHSIERSLERGVDAAALDPFTTRFEGLGVFPSMEYITVVWVGVTEGTSRLQTLQESVSAALAVDPDEAFVPHVTLARVDDARSKAAIQAFIEERSPALGTMTVESVQLTESTLTEDGPVYETVTSVPLSG